MLLSKKWRVKYVSPFLPARIRTAMRVFSGRLMQRLKIPSRNFETSANYGRNRLFYIIHTVSFVNAARVWNVWDVWWLSYAPSFGLFMYLYERFRSSRSASLTYILCNVYNFYYWLMPNARPHCAVARTSCEYWIFYLISISSLRIVSLVTHGKGFLSMFFTRYF